MKTAFKHSKCMPRLVLVLLPMFLSACALMPAPTPQPVVEAPVQAVQVVALEQHKAGAAFMPVSMIRRIAALQLRIDDYPIADTGWRFELAAVELLAQHANLASAQQRLALLEQQVVNETARYFQHHADAYLQQARQFSFLNSRQAGRLREAEFAAQRGEHAQAYRVSRSLVRELWSADAWLTVRAGDTLPRIAARRDVYDNYRLWPLLRAANKGYFYRQSQLQVGWRLRYPLHPRLDEIFAAVEGALK